MHTQPAPLEEGFEELAASSGMLRRVQIALLVGVLAVAAVVAARTLGSHSTPVRITVYGQAVADPAKVLDTAQQQFLSYAHERRGIVGKGAQCWFQRPADSSDIEGSLLCGPVLFYDDNPSTPYLRFELSAHGTNPVVLAPAARPISPDPVAAASDTTLVRPGRTAQPVDTAGFAAPIPPPAVANLLTMTDVVHPADLVSAPRTAVIGANTATVRLAGYGAVDDFGFGAAERSAPAGTQLFAFRLAFTGGENGFALLSQLDLAVTVGTSAPRPLHLPDKGVDKVGQLFVVAAPPTAPVSLVLTQNGVTQRLSLRDGKPAPGNIVLLQGSKPVQTTPVGGPVPALMSTGGRAHRMSLYVVVAGAAEQFFLPGSGQHPARTDHAFLLVDISFYDAQLPGRLNTTKHDFALADLTVTPRGGTPVRAQRADLLGTPLFDVPAATTDATLTIHGTTTGPGYAITVRTPATFHIHLTPTS